MSVIVPAHNEAAVIGRLLRRLGRPAADQDGPGPDADGPGIAPLRLIVVCNGCSDRTAEVAAAFAGVEVVSIPQPSKAAAMRAGDEVAGPLYPRVYLDADVEIDAEGLRALAAAVSGGDVLAAAPARVIPRDGVSRWVRWYYDVWEALPGVRIGIFGRGVIALSAAGHRRIDSLPLLMSDDLAISSAFSAGERRVVQQARVVVHPPRTWADLVRRRARVATGTAQVYGSVAEPVADSRTSPRDLLQLAAHRPGLAVKLPVFLAVAVLARRRAASAVRRSDYSTWLRDESSRQVASDG